ncbi:hypothetical protein [Micromonospora palythoicola]|uniref:hypothetical protein n=1 Tax=Micromonospora palythoicola TaxID=3120507 RepID=UPI002FCE437F
MENAQAAGGRRMWWWIGAAVLVIVVVVVATWTWVSVRGDGRDGHVVSGAVGDLREATFVLLDGADVIKVRTADLGDDAYRVSTPRDANVRPAVSLTDGSLLTSLRGTDRNGPAVVEAVLAESVRWHVRLDGGAKEQHLDLRGARVGDVEFTAGANRVELTLPAPEGTQRTLLGGASQIIVRLAGDAPVQVRAGGGAGSVTIDGTTHSGVAGGTTFTPPEWNSATDRYDIDATAGVSAITVERVDAG